MTSATYRTPASISTMTTDRAWSCTAMTSDSPTLVSVVNDRYRSSNHGSSLTPS